MECKHDHDTEEARKTVEEHIEQYGCHLTLIEGNDYLPAFVYSIGLHQKFDHPEIICFGLKTDVMATLINHAKDLVSQGDRIIPGILYEGYLHGFKIQFLPVDEEFYPNYLGYAGWFAGMNFDFPVLQLVWPDKQGLFPWEDGFNTDWKFKQPLLDRNTDFKFYEERNLGVYTTSEALDGEPILYAYHNTDGDWQFHTSNAPDLTHAKLVCLEEITKLDATVNEIYHLGYGWRAWRKSPADDWEYEEDSSEEEEEELPQQPKAIEKPPVVEKPKSLFQKLGSWFK